MSGASGSIWKVRSWSAPLARVDAGWTAIESWLCGALLMAEIAALCAWVLFRGFSTEHSGGDVSGVVLRSLVGAVIIGSLANVCARRFIAPRSKSGATWFVTIAVMLGVAAGPLWANVGVGYFSNLLNWLQNASTLMLVGGLRGVATRLTLCLALIGASLATAKGKHINIDVMMRFLSPNLRVPVAVAGWLAAAVVCVAAVWGFFDYIAIESFKAPASQPCAGDESAMCDTPPREKFSIVGRGVGHDLFLLGRQVSLDLRTIPHVIRGDRYDQYMTGGEWNEWLASADWSSQFGQDEVASLLVASDDLSQMHSPAVIVPGGGESARGLLVRDLNFVFPVGLLIIAVRFLLRSLLALGGQVSVDPDAVHGDDDIPVSGVMS